MQASLKRSSLAVIRWFDSWNGVENDPTVATVASAATAESPAKAKIDWGRVVPFLAMHAACLFVFVVARTRGRPCAISRAVHGGDLRGRLRDQAGDARAPRRATRALGVGV